MLVIAILIKTLVPYESMAEIAKEVNGFDPQDLHSLLSSPARDFLIRNDGEQVKMFFSSLFLPILSLWSWILTSVDFRLSVCACFAIYVISQPILLVYSSCV